jgi:hypothetical protein
MIYKNIRFNEKGYHTKGGLTPRQQLPTCCRQYFLVMTYQSDDLITLSATN